MADKELASAVKKGSEQWMRLYKKGDFKALANLYTADCQVYPPGKEMAVGREACARVWSELHKSGAARIVLESVETMQGGQEAGADHSNYYMYSAKGCELDHGKYVVVWKKIKDEWFLHYDIFNSDVPPKPTGLTEALEAVTARWLKAYNSQDFHTVASLYTEDCKVFPPGFPIAIGREACAAAWEGLYNMGGHKLAFKCEKTEDLGGNMASDSTFYWLYNKHDEMIDNGKYVVIWKKIDNQWMLHYDIFNSNRG